MKLEITGNQRDDGVRSISKAFDAQFEDSSALTPVAKSVKAQPAARKGAQVAQIQVVGAHLALLRPMTAPLTLSVLLGKAVVADGVTAVL